MKCDCNCTNEENRFYINSEESIEASRLISFNGISKIKFDEIKNDKNLCKWERYKKSYKNSLIFVVKVPDGNSSCFEIKEYSLDNFENFNHSIYYMIGMSGSFTQIEVVPVNTSLNQFRINELSNKLLKKDNRSKLLLKKGDLVKYKYNLGEKSIVKKDGVFFEVNNSYLVPDFYIKSKSYLYSSPDEKNKTKMYLVKRDRIKIINESINNDIRWFFINYKGKKEINMWIKADSVDLN
ncbi:hypothetical protein [Rodentibacter caecimuris]|uniref:hypothetical protein n=1 Tax=Rodentibacter caecimuris TaxID=1796644 RepID=UPI001B315760|nr:hypothetical protein [Pasteurella caecimuris]